MRLAVFTLVSLLAALAVRAEGASGTEQLIAQLRSRFLREREEAVEALVKCGPSVSKQIAALLDDSDTRVQRAAVEILSRLGTPDSIEPLLPLLSHPDPTIASLVHDAFLKAGRPVRPSLETARDNGQPALAQTIRDLLDEMTQEEIEAAFSSEVMDDATTGYYTGQFAKLKGLGPDIGPMLAKMATGATAFKHDRTPMASFRSMAIEAMADIDYKDGIQDLTRIAEENGDMARVAAGSLWRMGMREPAEKLEAKLKTDAPPAGVRLGMTNDLALAELYSRTDQFDKALDKYREMVTVSGRGMVNATTHYNMACTLARMGRKKEATESLRTAVRQGFRNVQWMKKDGDLEAIRGETEYRAIVQELSGEVIEAPPAPSGGGGGGSD